ncbi:hypothetical protein JCM6294_1548 [Bacteroides pyogenes DSM 20611 = JCM 6294]|uniref:Uncharacterized protein n=1 Tax=Bacteroides pyogenes DSM 20611 = JCM 6294 TaxID=1121100 RepID=W4PGT1_9BACE|nr:hypothetical protein JCM6294_1548 [Bacteroides pyogenes DSM 20611 = JCM 6294]
MVQTTDDAITQIENIIPGIYTISISGTGIDSEGNEYYLNGNLVNKAYMKGLKHWKLR